MTDRDKRDVFMGTTQAHAFLGARDVFHTFRFNPDDASWAYKENLNSTDTIGGRVVQLLSVQLTGMTVNGHAGSRAELQRLADNAKAIMAYHIRTSRPVSFRVPSRKWDFIVYLTDMPQIGWDVAATSYPYSLNLSVSDDLTGVQTKRLEKAALTRLADGIGYNPAVHGGDYKGFQKLVDSLVAGNGGTDTGTSGNGGNPNAPSPGDTTDSIKTVWDAVHQQFPDVCSAGTFVCKTILGSSDYSQHAWGNAWDICAPGGVSDSPTAQKYLDQVAKWLEQNTVSSQGGGGGQNLPIAQIIWRGWEQLHGGDVYDHTNHIHVSGNPMFSGTPPCA